MKCFDLPMPLRRLLAWAYLLLAAGAALLVLLMPGQPPLSVNKSVLQVESGRFANHASALGQGADKYAVDVLNDLAGIVASAAADYPDGSNAVLALFDSPASAASAHAHLKAMVPHHNEEVDLWSTHFTSDSGEYVMLALAEHVLVMIIGEREAMNRERLAGLPALAYNPRPGLGAVLQQQSGVTFMLVMAFYVVVQSLFVRLLFSWAGIAAMQTAVNEDDEAN